MRLIKNSDYILRCIDSVYILVPFRRTINGLRLFSFNSIGADIFQECSKYVASEDLKAYILKKHYRTGLSEDSYDTFVKQLIKYEILLEE